MAEHADRQCAAVVRREKKAARATVKKPESVADGRPSALHEKYLFIVMIEKGGGAEIALTMLRRFGRLNLAWHRLVYRGAALVSRRLCLFISVA